MPGRVAPGFPEKIEGIGWSVIVRESRSDRTCRGVETPERRRNETSRRAAVLHSHPEMESLESRILLSGNPEPDPRFAFMGPPPGAPALIVPLAVLPLATMTSSLSTARVQPLAVSVSGSAVALPTPRLGVIILPPDSSMNPVVGGANGEDFGTQAGDSADLRRTVNLGDIASLRANGEMPPVVIAMDGRMPVGGELGPNDPNLAGTTSGSPPSGSAGPNVVSLPSAPRMEVEGNVDSTEGSITVQIPIDALTQSVRLVLHPPLGLPNGDSTVLGKISLIDPSGQTLAEIEPSPNTDSASPEDLTVAMENAPAGGQLVVRVARVPGVQSVAGSLPPSTFQSNIPFLLDVQRQDQPSTETSAPTTSEPGWFGTFALTSAGPSGQSSPSASSVSTGDPSSDAANGDQATEVPPAGTPINIGSQDDGYYVRLATGPPVSRSSGPLGPVLAASDTDPTPPVDRHERALLQEIPSLDRENDSEDPADSISRGRWAVVQVEEDLSQDQSGGRHVTVVLGAGGFPMKVTSRLSGDRAGLAGLLAALPAPVEPASPADSPPGSFAASDDGSVDRTAQVSYSADRRGYPDYLKAACGFVLGLGLTSGPLFSDLITSLRRKTPRWLPEARLGHAADDSPPRRRRQPLRALLRGLLGRG